MNHNERENLTALDFDESQSNGEWSTSSFIFISIVEVAAGLAVPLLTMKLINQISDTGFALTSLLPVIGVLIVQAMLSAVTFYMMRRLGEGVVANLRTEIWEHMLHLRLTYYDAHESGETMSRITQDTNVVKEFVTEKLVSFISGLFAILGAIVVLLWIDWKMTLLLLIAVPLTIFVTYPLGEKCTRFRKPIKMSWQDLADD